MAEAPAETLREKVERRYGLKCPCCNVMMLAPSMLPQRCRTHDRTRAHVWSTRHPGRPRSAWFFACRRCNHDQAHLSLDEWFLVLAYRGDPRHRRVLALLRFIGEAAPISDAAT